VIYETTRRFEKSFAKLPELIQKRAKEALERFMENPRHRSLRVKKIEGAKDIWEGRVDDFYRFTFQFSKDREADDTVCTFRNIGPHDITKTAP
jgi:mRNA interferase RelE/StbE